MKRMLTLGMMAALAMMIYAAEMGDIGINHVKKSNGSVVAVDTLAPDDTLFTAVYAVDNVRGMSSNTSLWIKLDSIRDSTWCVVKLQESYDKGATWEFTVTVCSVATIAASVDTAVDVDLFPTPFFRFLVIEIGSSADSFSVEEMIFYNHAR